MNPTSLYVSTSRLVFQNDGNEQNWTDLYRLVPYLRQSLSCTVCGNLLIEPFTPSETNCQHHVCKLCIGGRKNLKPSCNWCRDLQNYDENVQLRILLQCYKSLCEYIINSPIFQTMRKQTQNATVLNGTQLAGNSLLELIEEGARFQDEYKSNSGLSKSAYSILPCVYTNSSTQTLSNTTSNIPNNTVDQSKEISSPIKTVSNGSAMYSVLYAGSGNKITIKRKTDLEDDTVTKDTNNVATNFKKPSSSRTKTVGKRKGCRCGNATPTPGKLTCCGQRCPCYVESKSCIDCKCRGCRNPHTPDGYKVRPHIPELRNLEMKLNNDTAQTTNTKCLEIKLESYNSTNNRNEQNNFGINSRVSPTIATTPSTTMDLSNDLVFNTNDMSPDNIHVVNVYTTHLPEVTPNLPANLMDDSKCTSHTTTNNRIIHQQNNLINSPTTQHNTNYNEEISNLHNPISESSSDDPSDVEIEV